MTAPDFPPRLNADPFAEIRELWEQGKRAREQYHNHGHNAWRWVAECRCTRCEWAREEQRLRRARRKESANG